MAAYGQPGLYGEPQAPSLTEQMFGSPLKAQWTLQKSSMLMTFMNNSTWKAAMEGKGLKWSGVVGFRGIALGQNATGITKSISPARVIEGVVRNLGFKDAADSFAKNGLLGKHAGDRVLGSLGRLFGGGTLEFTKYDESTKRFIQRSGVSVLSRAGFKASDIKMLRSRWGTNVWSSKSTVEDLYKSGVFKGSPEATKAAEAILSQKTNIGKVTQFDRSGLKNNILKKKAIIRAAKIGRFATWAGVVNVAFDVGKVISEAGFRAAGSIADLAEQKLSGLINRNMEFGGKVGIGFYAGQSGTERQRALSAISGGRGGGPAFGNEAGYQHVASTW